MSKIELKYYKLMYMLFIVLLIVIMCVFIRRLNSFVCLLVG